MARSLWCLPYVITLMLMEVLLPEIHGLDRREVFVWSQEFIPNFPFPMAAVLSCVVILIKARVRVIRNFSLFWLVMFVVYEVAINPKSVTKTLNFLGPSRDGEYHDNLCDVMWCDVMWFNAMYKYVRETIMIRIEIRHVLKKTTTRKEGRGTRNTK